MAKKIKISQIKKMASWELEELDASSLGPKQAEAYDARLDLLNLCNFLYDYGKYVESLKVIPEGEDIAESHAHDIATIKELNEDDLYEVFQVDNGVKMVELTARDTTPLRYKFRQGTGELLKGYFNFKTLIGKRMGKDGHWFPVFLRVPNVWESKKALKGKIRLVTYASAVRKCEGSLDKLHLNFRPLSSVLSYELQKEQAEKERMERNAWVKELA